MSTTLYYNVPYLKLPEALKDGYTPTTYERHPNFDLYAYGKMLSDVFKLENTHSAGLGDYIHENLVWICNNLTQLNPNHRPNCEEIAILMKYIFSLFVLQNKS